MPNLQEYMTIREAAAFLGDTPIIVDAAENVVESANVL